MLKRIIVIFVILLSVSPCFGSGWNDYELDIGDGYYVYRCNSMDVCIGKANGGLILYPDKYDNVGPVIRYITTPEYIFTKNLGRIPRHLFEGDTFDDIDPSKEFFFVISKVNDEVVGPLSAEDFVKQTEIFSLNTLDWQIPKNPNFWLPLLGNLMFILYLTVRFFWITIPVIIVIILLIKHIK